MATTVKRLDYTPNPWTIDSVTLKFSIAEGSTTVESTMRLLPRGAGAPPSRIALHRGKDVDVKAVRLGESAVEFSTPEGYLEVVVPEGQGTCAAPSWCSGRFSQRAVHRPPSVHKAPPHHPSPSPNPTISWESQAPH